MPDLSGVGSVVGAAYSEDDKAPRFVLQVKKTVERCLGQGMNKGEMFRVIREEGVPLWIAFAVYRELREQHRDFFEEYYCMIDLMEQRQKLGRLIQAYRAGGSNAAVRSRALETTAAAAAMETDATDSTEWSNQQAEHDDFQIAGASVPQQAVHFPGGQQLHGHQQTVDDVWLRETAWAEEAVPMLARQQQLYSIEQSAANGMFPGVAWPQHLPALSQLHCQAQAAHMPAGQQLRYQKQVVQLPAGQQLLYQEQAGHLPVRRQQQAVHLPAEQQPIANGGFYGAPLVPSAEGLLDGHWWGQRQQAEPLRQWWPADPSSTYTLPGFELPGNQQDKPLQKWWPGDLSSSSTLPGFELPVNQQAQPLRQWWPGNPSSSSTLPAFTLQGNQNYRSNAGFHHERHQAIRSVACMSSATNR